jgi:TonB family protein
MDVPVWVLVERDGTVSRAEVRMALAVSGPDTVAASLARKARFQPARMGGRAVRCTRTITVRFGQQPRPGK